MPIVRSLPEISFRPCPCPGPTCFVAGQYVPPNAAVELADGTRVFLLDLLMLWSREPARTQTEIALAQRYVSHHVEAMR